MTWEQRVLADDPTLEASQNIPDFPYANNAELLGFKGISEGSLDQVADAWEEALAADRPVLDEAVTDPRSAAAAAAHPLRVSQADGPGAGQARPERSQDHRTVDQGQAPGLHHPLKGPDHKRPARPLSSGPTGARFYPYSTERARRRSSEPRKRCEGWSAWRRRQAFAGSLSRYSLGLKRRT